MGKLLVHPCAYSSWPGVAQRRHARAGDNIFHLEVPVTSVLALVNDVP